MIFRKRKKKNEKPKESKLYPIKKVPRTVHYLEQRQTMAVNYITQLRHED